MANSGQTGFFEIVNSNISIPYLSASNYDMVIRTDKINQRIFIGNGSNPSTLPGIILNNNNVGINISNPTEKLHIVGNIIVTGSISGSGTNITSLNATNITTGILPVALIANLAITGSKIANNTITATQIAPLTVTSAEIANNTITNTNISSVDAGKITTGTLTVTRGGTGVTTSTGTGNNVLNNGPFFYNTIFLNNFGWINGNTSTERDPLIIRISSISSTNSYNSIGRYVDNIGFYGPNQELSGFIENNTSGTQLNFTGQHRVANTTSIIDENHQGMIVISQGTYINLDSSIEPSINESLPDCTLSSQSNDKRVFGVISTKEDSNDDGTRHYAQGSFVTVLQKIDGLTRIIINSLGEGSMWVCNVNGDLYNGDYITSSIVIGYGMKQDDDFLHNYTVGKITCDCIFTNLPIWIKTRKIEYNGIEYICAFIGCTYHCG